MPVKSNDDQQEQQRKFPATGTGNASNPEPEDDDDQPVAHQLIDERGERYLRESANIEDMPDATDQEEADDIIRREKKAD